MAKLYRLMRRGELRDEAGTALTLAEGERLVRSLTAIRQALEAGELEKRLEALEERDSK